MPAFNLTAVQSANVLAVLSKKLPIRLPANYALPCALFCLCISNLGLCAETSHRLDSLERSFWLHASLAAQSQRGYWGPHFAPSAVPSEDHIRNAARLLTETYAANRLYLVYHQECPSGDIEKVFCWWRQHCPRETQLVPTVVLRMYDKENSPVFRSEELRRFVEFCRRSISDDLFAVYDVYSNREQGDSLQFLSQQYPKGLIRVGIQPDEVIASPFNSAVQDTWSGVCHGTTNADWLDRGFGAETLRNWVDARNRQSCPVAWDLIAVAWDYHATERGGYPGYDDAARNMPLPAGRNRLAAKEILHTARLGLLAGFSSDLLILQANSQHPARDGTSNSFYETLKRGTVYRGSFSEPFNEVAELFAEFRNGKTTVAD